MSKKETNKSLVLGIVFFLFWMGLYVTFAAIFEKGSGQATQQFVSSHFNDMLTYLSFKNLAGPAEVLITIILYFIILVALLIALIWVNLAIKAKQGKIALGFIIFWILIFPLFEMVAAFYPYSGGNDYVHYTSYLGFITNPGMGIPMKILLFLLLALAFLSALFGIIHAVIRMVRFSRKKAQLEEDALINEERESLESVIAEREAEEAKLEELRARRAREEESLDSLEEVPSAKLLDLIRQVVREEMGHKESPQIIQNFYGIGVSNSVNDEPKPEPEAEPEPEVVSEAVLEPVIEEAVEEPVAEVAEPIEKKPIIRIPFKQRMIDAEQEMKDNYNELKNELLSWGLKSRLSSSGDSFRLHCKTYCKVSIAGKSLKLYLALNPEDYKDSTLPIQNAGEKNVYQEIPLVFKVRSGLSMRRAKALIRDACEKDNLEQEIIGNEDWASKLSLESEEESDSSED